MLERGFVFSFSRKLSCPRKQTRGYPLTIPLALFVSKRRRILLVMLADVDPRVHINEPGATLRGCSGSVTRAAVAGGTTVPLECASTTRLSSMYWYSGIGRASLCPATTAMRHFLSRGALARRNMRTSWKVAPAPSNAESCRMLLPVLQDSIRGPD